MSLTSSSASERDLQRGKIVPWVIVAFFLSFMIPIIGFVYIAFTNKPSEVTQNAYQKGLAYNNVLAEAESEKKLGWKAAIEINKNKLIFSLADAKGKPIKSAKVKAWLIRPSSSEMDTEVSITETSGGKYEAPLSLKKGLWEARITAESNGREIQASKMFTAD